MVHGLREKKLDIFLISFFHASITTGIGEMFLIKTNKQIILETKFFTFSYCRDGWVGDFAITNRVNEQIIYFIPL